MYWFVALCFLNLVLLTTLVECDNCDTLLSSNTLKWKEDLNDSVETVTLSLEKVSNNNNNNNNNYTTNNNYNNNNMMMIMIMIMIIMS